MIFEKSGAVQIDKDLQCFKVQVGTKIYLIGLQDIEQALKCCKVMSVFQVDETLNQQENAKKVV